MLLFAAADGLGRSRPEASQGHFISASTKYEQEYEDGYQTEIWYST